MLGKISKITPSLRLSGRQKSGAVHRPKDQRTHEELIDTIEYFTSSMSKDLKNLMSRIKEMNPKYLGLVSDTLELSKIHSMSIRKNPLNMKLPNNKTVVEFLIPKFIKASISEHKALDFAAEVINNTDYKASQRFLSELSIANVLENPKMSEKFDAARPMIRDMAESMLKPPYLGNNSLDNFMEFIKILTAENANTDKVALLKPFSDFIHKTFKQTKPIIVSEFVKSDVPNEKIIDNMNTLAQMAENFEKSNSKIDVVNFVLKNTNLR